MRIRKGDLVHVLSGKDRGKQGRVIDARPKDRKVIVENINIAKRHTKPRQSQGRTDRAPKVQQGGILDIALPFDVQTAPVDARLPGGGGNQICGLYDVTPTLFGQVNNVVTYWVDMSHLTGTLTAPTIRRSPRPIRLARVPRTRGWSATSVTPFVTTTR